MATIPRDVGQVVDLNDPITLAEYEGFAADVPHTDGMIAAANNLVHEDNTPANAVRAAKLLREGFLTGLVPGNDNLPTPDLVVPTAPLIERQGLHAGTDLVVPSSAGGIWAEVETWSFEDTGSAGTRSWPAPLIRVREGQVVHTDLGSSTGPHTIHHHGIEPTPMNDGVGHLTFEISGGQYVYQWVAAEAGTYFYHCHRNTVLHFERGMYGGLIVDPPEGPGWTYVGNSKVQYQAEAFWVVDDIDTRFHGLDKDDNGTDINYGAGRIVIDHVASGIQERGAGKLGDAVNAFTVITDPDNPRLHDFDPNVFAVTGAAVPVNPVPQLEPGMPPGTPLIPRTVDNHRLVQMGVTVNAGAKVLVRTLNAAYCHTRWTFPSQIPGQVIAADGRTFGKAPWGAGYSNPVPLEDIDYRFQLSTARRWDVLLDTNGVVPGIYDVAVSVHSTVGDHRLVTIRLPITVL